MRDAMGPPGGTDRVTARETCAFAGRDAAPEGMHRGADGKAAHGGGAMTMKGTTRPAVRIAAA